MKQIKQKRSQNTTRRPVLCGDDNVHGDNIQLTLQTSSI